MPTSASNAHATMHPARSSHAYRVLVAAILCTAVYLRVAALERYPLPIHQDELTDIYDGYSLATTGADRNGERWPILFRGIGPGDYHPGAYAYLAAIPGYFAGFSVWAGRLPAALAGIMTVWLVFLTARHLTDDRTTLLALLFAAWSPIHILYSRQAHLGTCLVPWCVISIVYLLVRWSAEVRPVMTRKGFRLALLAGFIVGLSTNAYTGQRLTAFLFGITALLAIGWMVGFRHREYRRALLHGGGFLMAALIGAAPQLYAMIAQPEQFFARANATVYPLHCGVQWWTERILKNLVLNLDPHYLFLSFGEYSLLSVARLNVASLPFLYVGLAATCLMAIRRTTDGLAWIPIGVLFSLAPALITEGNPSSMRTSGVWALYPIVCAVGVSLFARIMHVALPWTMRILRQGAGAASYHRRIDSGTLTTTAVALLIVGAGMFDTTRYVSRPELHTIASQHDFVRIGEWLKVHGDNYERVYVDAPGMFGYLYLAAFTGMTPEEFSAAPREGSMRGLGWDEYHRFGRFHFASSEIARREWERLQPDQTWLVIDPRLEPVLLEPEPGRITSAARASGVLP